MGRLLVLIPQERGNRSIAVMVINWTCNILGQKSWYYTRCTFTKNWSRRLSGMFTAANEAQHGDQLNSSVASTDSSSDILAFWRDNCHLCGQKCHQWPSFRWFQQLKPLLTVFSITGRTWGSPSLTEYWFSGQSVVCPLTASTCDDCQLHHLAGYGVTVTECYPCGLWIGIVFNRGPVFLPDITEWGKFPPESLNSSGNFCWCKFLNVVPALLADTAGFSEGVCKEYFAAGCDFRAQNTPKCVCGRGFAPDHTPRLQSSKTP